MIPIKYKKYIAAIIDVYVFPNSLVFLGVWLYFRAYNYDIISEHIEYALPLIWGGILTKDIYNGQSIGKRLMGIQVISQREQSAISSIKSILRNATGLFMFPIEALFYLLSRRRIGDRLLNSDVVEGKVYTIIDICRTFTPLSFLIWLLYFIISVLMIQLGGMIFSFLWTLYFDN